jgi:hypothetical protein
LKNGHGTIRNCIIPAVITNDLLLSARRVDGIMYSLAGRTDVGLDTSQTSGGDAGSITVLPGVTVFGVVPQSNLLVNRGSQLVADGNSTNPIIFTSRSNLDDDALSEYATNQWGGIILNGRAPVSDCDAAAGGTSQEGGNAGCWRQSEGVIPRPAYGGATPTDNSGTLEYVQINFSGVSIGSNDEIQGLTLNGTGSGTTINHIQIHNSSDDGIEIFGGRSNLKYLALTGNADDSLDTDNGYQGFVQFVLGMRHDASGYDGDPGALGETTLEVDSTAANDAFPRQFLRLANFTLIQRKSGETTMRIRGGADIALLNGVVVAPDGSAVGCLDIDDPQTVQTSAAFPGNPPTTGPDLGPPMMASVAFDCDLVPDADADTFEADTLAGKPNVNTSFTNTLLFLDGVNVGRIADGTNELAVTAVADLTTNSVYGGSFFTQVNYIGAFSGPTDPWTVGWTCNSVVANLRGATACSDVRWF